MPENGLLRNFENGMLRRIYGYGRDRVVRGRKGTAYRRFSEFVHVTKYCVAQLR